MSEHQVKLSAEGLGARKDSNAMKITIGVISGLIVIVIAEFFSVIDVTGYIDSAIDRKIEQTVRSMDLVTNDDLNKLMEMIEEKLAEAQNLEENWLSQLVEWLHHIEGREDPKYRVGVPFEDLEYREVLEVEYGRRLIVPELDWLTVAGFRSYPHGHEDKAVFVTVLTESDGAPIIIASMRKSRPSHMDAIEHSLHGVQVREFVLDGYIYAIVGYAGFKTLRDIHNAMQPLLAQK